MSVYDSNQYVAISEITSSSRSVRLFESNEERAIQAEQRLPHLDLSVTVVPLLASDDGSDSERDSVIDYVDNEAGDPVIQHFRKEEYHSLPAAESQHYVDRRLIASDALHHKLTRHFVRESSQKELVNSDGVVVKLIVPVKPIGQQSSDSSSDDSNSLDPDEYVRHVLQQSRLANSTDGFDDCEIIDGGRRRVLVVSDNPSLLTNDTIVIGSRNNVMGDRNLIVGDYNAGYGNYLRARGSHNRLIGVHCINLDTGRFGSASGSQSRRIGTAPSNVRLTIGSGTAAHSIIVPLSISAKTQYDSAESGSPSPPPLPYSASHESVRNVKYRRVRVRRKSKK